MKMQYKNAKMNGWDKAELTEPLCEYHFCITISVTVPFKKW